MVIQGEADTAVPAAVTTALVDNLREMGTMVEYELVRVPRIPRPLCREMPSWCALFKPICLRNSILLKKLAD